jgi:hypothetical protein
VRDHKYGGSGCKKIAIWLPFFYNADMSNKTDMTTALVLELPGKGAYAPNKFGCMYGNFIKSNIAGASKPMWIYEGRTYDASVPEQIENFNNMCAKIVPHCYSMRMHVVPKIVRIPQSQEIATTEVSDTTDDAIEPLAPKLPELTQPPSRGKKKIEV